VTAAVARRRLAQDARVFARAQADTPSQAAASVAAEAETAATLA
jgi:hypothetical protein